MDRDLITRLRNESFKWVDIARMLNISSKTLIRRRKEFEMPIGQDAFSNIGNQELDEYVRDILELLRLEGILWKVGSGQGD